ncbi:MAG: GNAT family N-acetyltransferase [Deltaproteobacteria bacterium]|nr:GNAT family N-acetyltransferase [Deltaproteobacteria bacterium]
MRDSFHIRNAAVEDFHKACSLIYQSSPRDFDFLFSSSQHSPLDFLHYAFQKKKDFLSHEVHRVLEKSGEVMGVGAFYSRKNYAVLEKGHEAHVEEFYRQDAAVIFKREEGLDDYLPLPPSHTLYIANLAIDPPFQHQGAMSFFLSQQFAKAKAEGFQFCALDVDTDNFVAQNLYKKLGFENHGEKSFFFKGKRGLLQNVYRMVLDLDSSKN